jgi:hypothetical protein
MQSRTIRRDKVRVDEKATRCARGDGVVNQLFARDDGMDSGGCRARLQSESILEELWWFANRTEGVMKMLLQAM